MEHVPADLRRDEPGAVEARQFFVYGGFIVAAEAVGPLNDEIAEIREQRGFRPGDRLKHQNKSRPQLPRFDVPFVGRAYDRPLRLLTRRTSSSPTPRGRMTTARRTAPLATPTTTATPT